MSQRPQQGFTLVELMIGMVVGLLLISAAFQSYLIASELSRVRAGLSFQGTTASFVNHYLSRHVRAAGHGGLIPPVGGDANSFSVSYRYDTDLPLVEAGRDCLGRIINAADPERIDRFLVQDGYLVCRSTAGGIETSERIASGVAGLTVSYLFTRGGAEAFQATPPADATEWASVRALRISVQLAGTGQDVPARTLTFTAALRSFMAL